MKVIVIAGTPGVGKTTLSRLLATRLNAIHVDLSRLAIEKKLFSHYDEERQTYVIDEHAVVEEVSKIIRECDRSVIIDTHYPEILPPEMVDIVIVLRLHPRKLEERLWRKGWQWNKIRENVLAEILSVVSINAIQRFGTNRVYEVDVTEKSVEEILETVIEIIEKRRGFKTGLQIDWLTIISPEEISRYEKKEV